MLLTPIRKSLVHSYAKIYHHSLRIQIFEKFSPLNSVQASIKAHQSPRILKHVQVTHLRFLEVHSVILLKNDLFSSKLAVLWVEK